MGPAGNSQRGPWLSSCEGGAPVPDRSRRPGLADDAIGGAGPQCPQPGELGNVPPCHWVRVLLPPVPAGAVGIEAVGHLLPDAGIIGAEAVGAQLGLTSGAFGIVWSAFGSLNFPNGKNVLHAAGMLSIQALTFGSIERANTTASPVRSAPKKSIAKLPALTAASTVPRRRRAEAASPTRTSATRSQRVGRNRIGR